MNAEINEKNDTFIDDEFEERYVANVEDNQNTEEDLDDYSNSISIDQEDMISKLEKIEINCISQLSRPRVWFSIILFPY